MRIVPKVTLLLVGGAALAVLCWMTLTSRSLTTRRPINTSEENSQPRSSVPGGTQSLSVESKPKSASETVADSLTERFEAEIEDAPAPPPDTASLMLAMHEAVYASSISDRVRAITVLRSYLDARLDDSHLDAVIRTLVHAAEFDTEIQGRYEAMQGLCFQVSEEAFDAFLRIGPLDSDAPIRWLWVRRLESLSDSERYASLLRPTAPRDKSITTEPFSEIRKRRISKAIEKLERVILVEPDLEIREKAEVVLAKLKS